MNIFTVLSFCLLLCFAFAQDNPIRVFDNPQSPFETVLKHRPVVGTRIVVRGTPRSDGQQFLLELLGSLFARYFIGPVGNAAGGYLRFGSGSLTSLSLSERDHCFNPGQPFDFQIRFRKDEYGLYCGDREFATSRQFHGRRNNIKVFKISGDVDIERIEIYQPGVEVPTTLAPSTTIGPAITPAPFNSVLANRMIQSISLDLLQAREQLRDVIDNQQRLEQKLDQVLTRLGQGLINSVQTTAAPNVHARREMDMSSFDYNMLTTISGTARGNFVIKFLMSRDGQSAFTVKVDFDRREVIRNADVDPNNTGDETNDGFPFQLNQPFTIKVTKDHGWFYIHVNDVRHSSFAYRTVDHINKCVVEGAVEITRLTNEVPADFQIIRNMHS